LAVLLSTFVISLGLRLFLALQTAESKYLTMSESSAMWINLSRVLAQDVHAATGVSVVFGNLNVTLANGTSYRYVVNGNHQCVRIQSGGGTSVIAAGVSSVQVTPLSPVAVFVSAVFTDGSVHSLTLASLKAM
jgi:hypothetical protein